MIEYSFYTAPEFSEIVSALVGPIDGILFRLLRCLYYLLEFKSDDYFFILTFD